MRSENLTGITSPKSCLKEEPKISEQSVISPKTEKCRWGPDCPFCKNQDKEDWGWQTPKSVTAENITLAKSAKAPSKIPLSLQKPDQEAPIDKYQWEQWEAEMERLNTKYNLDCFSDSELYSESNEGGQYCYKHGYETLI